MSKKATDEREPTRSGRVALVGRPNVGKSTLLNAALGQPLAIVSPTPQTTRDALLGVVHHGDAELLLLDTPGLHKPTHLLGRRMNREARDAARAADVVVFVAEVPRVRPTRGGGSAEGAALRPHPADAALLADVELGAQKGASDERPTPFVLVLNKVDLARDKRALLPLLEAYSALRPFEAIIPLSARREVATPDAPARRDGGVGRVLDEVAKLLPEGPFQFGDDDLTDRPTRYFAAEYVREQILRRARQEVPHATAVAIERFVRVGSAFHIDATIHVERMGQKKIMIGAGGEALKAIGTMARQRVEELVGAPVMLKLWVRVTERWRDQDRLVQELAFDRGEGGATQGGDDT